MELSGWAEILYRYAPVAIIWLVLLTTPALWLVRIRKDPLTFPGYRALLGLLLIGCAIGFAGVSWNASPDHSLRWVVDFSGVADARIFGIALVLLCGAIAITSVLELSWQQLRLEARAALFGSDLFLTGCFVGVSAATSGWTTSVVGKLLWTVGPVILMVAYLIRIVGAGRARGQRSDIGPAAQQLTAAG